MSLPDRGADGVDDYDFAHDVPPRSTMPGSPHERKSYLTVIIVTLVSVLRTLGRLGSAERSVSGARRYLPALLLPFGFLVPPCVMLLRARELAASWNAIRLLGLVLGLYAAVMVPWAAATLGRSLVPRTVVFPDHTLVVRVPFRLVRHPVYSGDLTLWLGAALGT